MDGNDKPLPPSNYSTDSGSPSARPVRLTSPADFAYAGSIVAVTADINRTGAVSWQLEYGAEVNPDRWFSIGERQPVDESGSIAATWQTALFSGIYTLRLSVTFADGSIETDTRLLTFDNTPPAVTLRTAAGVNTIRYPAQRLLSLQADVSDNLTIERVEFLRDGNSWAKIAIGPMAINMNWLASASLCLPRSPTIKWGIGRRPG